MFKERGCGVLLHVTSLPSRFAIGDFGPEAHRFADFLYKSKIKYWQILPLNPINASSSFSPYSSDSAFAGNTLLISPEVLVQEELLSESELPDEHFYLNFKKAQEINDELLNKAFYNAKANSALQSEIINFSSAHQEWLDDYALYRSIKKHYNNICWNEWPDELKHRNSISLTNFKTQHTEEIEKVIFRQFIFFRQWKMLKDYCNQRNIKIIGDIPYYVAYDSADVWTNADMFKLNKDKEREFVGGVPPDYFSEEGQLWGNPVYNWESLKQNNFKWLISRIDHNLKLTDLLRLDHFRAFSAYWEVPASESTAKNGKWITVPGENFFSILNKELNSLALIAEDLGDIDENVRQLMNKFNFPGMKVLQFAFDHKISHSPDAPHNHIPHGIVYTGTHDNPTTKTWFLNSAQEDKIKLRQYTGVEINEDNVSWVLIRLAMMSVAKICVIPMQDFLSLGREAVMNTPGTSIGNWQYQMTAGDLSNDLSQKIAATIKLYERN